jgi:hypothetical protein
MAVTPLIKTGYDFRRVVTILEDGAPMNLTGATAGKAVLKNRVKSLELIADTVIDLNAIGTDLPNGMIVVAFSSAATAAIAASGIGIGFIEIAIVKDGARLPIEDLEVAIEKGYALS